MRWFETLLTRPRAEYRERLLSQLAKQALPLVLQRIQALPFPHNAAQARGTLLAFASDATRRLVMSVAANDLLRAQVSDRELRGLLGERVVTLALPLWEEERASMAAHRQAG